MQLDLNRFTEIEDATIGILTIDGEFQCFTLEHVERRRRLAKATAIPCGDYPVKLTLSRRFSGSYKAFGLSELVPLLTGVPNDEGIRIHMGRNARWSEGCILVGRWDTRHGAEISDSYEVYKALHERLSQARAEIRISVRSTTGKFDAGVTHPAPPLFRRQYYFEGLDHGAGRHAGFGAEDEPHMSVAGAGG